MRVPRHQRTIKLAQCTAAYTVQLALEGLEVLFCHPPNVAGRRDRVKPEGGAGGAVCPALRYRFWLAEQREPEVPLCTPTTVHAQHACYTNYPGLQQHHFSVHSSLREPFSG